MQRYTKRVVTSFVVLGLLGASGAALMADDDSDDDGYGGSGRWRAGSEAGMMANENPTYAEECGSCHFAYPPGLLPPGSWESIMAGLDDHFGDNASLADQQLVLIRNYLLDNAAGRSTSGVSRKAMAGLGEQARPLRITETAWFRGEHDEVPRNRVVDNPQVLSFSNCIACHTRAAQGSFSEHEVRIPGYRRWED